MVNGVRQTTSGVVLTSSGVAQTVVSGGGPTIVDDYEDNDLSEYSNPGAYTTQTGTVYEGTYAVANTGSSNNQFLYSTSGLPAYPQQGDTYSAWAHDYDGGIPEVAYGVQGSSSYYSMTVIPDSDEIRIRKETTDLASNSSVSLSQGNWYECVMTWATDGSMLFEIYDTSGTKLGDVSTTDGSYTDGGIGLRNGRGGNGCAMDYARIL